MGYSILRSKEAAFKQKYFPLFVRVVVGIIAAVAILVEWNEDRHFFTFGWRVIFIIFISGIAILSMRLRYTFCQNCGATNRFYTGFRSMRTHCKKCGQPFDKTENKSLSDYLKQ